MKDEMSGKEAHRLEFCNYTGKWIAPENVKASKWIGKTKRLVISKKAWSNMEFRKMYKNNQAVYEG
ncbi:hypothetical protein DRN67_04080 [Candidatus Micrarchaeota archaeon]|nr:MAG: hypothetical protein DRN67_04080 [Candidatus Micrarchaeota archaeon]